MAKLKSLIKTNILEFFKLLTVKQIFNRLFNLIASITIKLVNFNRSDELLEIINIRINESNV